LARLYYERLSEESAAYLEREGSRQRSHVAMTLIFDAGPLLTDEGGIDFDRIRRVIESRLGDLPKLRARLRRVPFDQHQVWVDDPEFNLDYHLRQSSLPRPGNHDQLCRTAARIAASRLDRSRPLWDLWVLEGLEGGRFALIFKIHKSLLSEEGTDLLRTILSISDEPFSGSPAPYRPRPAPSPVELFVKEVLQGWSPSRRIVSRGLRWLRHPAQASHELQDRGRNVLRVLGYGLRPKSESPFDGALGPHRSYEVESISLEDVQTIRRSLGGSIHDCVLGVLTGALRRFLEGRFYSPVAVDLRALTPVLAVDQKEARPWMVELPIWEEDEPTRHRLIREQTRRIRMEEEGVASGEDLTASADWDASRLFSLGARAIGRISTGQLVVLQCPGPQEPLYLDGAELQEWYGHLPLQDAAGLIITVVSYAGSLFVALNADPEIVPDLAALRQAIALEVQSLRALADGQGPALRAVSS
jgi:WS/DGAT/MGAT family acyltransferase